MVTARVNTECTSSYINKAAGIQSHELQLLYSSFWGMFMCGFPPLKGKCLLFYWAVFHQKYLLMLVVLVMCHRSYLNKNIRLVFVT